MELSRALNLPFKPFRSFNSLQYYVGYHGYLDESRIDVVSEAWDSIECLTMRARGVMPLDGLSCIAKPQKFPAHLSHHQAVIDGFPTTHQPASGTFYKFCLDFSKKNTFFMSLLPALAAFAPLWHSQNQNNFNRVDWHVRVIRENFDHSHQTASWAFWKPFSGILRKACIYFSPGHHIAASFDLFTASTTTIPHQVMLFIKKIIMARYQAINQLLCCSRSCFVEFWMVLGTRISLLNALGDVTSGIFINTTSTTIPHQAMLFIKKILMAQYQATKQLLSPSRSCFVEFWMTLGASQPVECLRWYDFRYFRQYDFPEPFSGLKIYFTRRSRCNATD